MRKSSPEALQPALPSRRQLLATAAAAAALPGCATVASSQRVQGLATGGCWARYCRHFAAQPGLPEGTGRCSLNQAP